MGSLFSYQGYKMTLYKWSQTASADATADSTINWAEGQAPSSVNDSARAMMAATAKYRDDIAGAILTSGTSTAYIVSSYQVFDTPAHLNGQMIAFTPHTTNAATVTLNVDSLGAKPLRSAPGVELLAGTIIQGTPYIATYNNSDGAFYLHGFFGNPFNIPIGAGLDFWGTSTPNSSFAFPTGQAISRATYAALFAIMGTTYGVGDGSTTFNLPDKTGRVSAMKEATPTRLTALGFGIGGSISSNMGATGGIDNEALVLGNLPTGITVAGAISVTSTVGGIPYNVPGENSFSGVGTPAWSGGTDGSISSTGTANLVSNNTGSQATGGARNVPICQPTIISNYIIRII
jgi:microcystin-dependent protein